MDKLDRALALYAEQYVKEEAAYFLGLDVSGIEFNEQIKKRMLRYAFKRSRYEYKRYTVKVILVACLVAMSVAFTACVSIPKIREVIWNTVIEWYDDHISVKFEEIIGQTVDTTKSPETSEDPSSAGISDGTETSTTTEVAVTPPKTIEQKAYIANLPEGYYAENGQESTIDCETNFYNLDGGWIFWLYQRVLNNDPIFLDSENQDIIETKINDNTAFLLRDMDSENVYTLIWTDGAYEYTLYGIFNSAEELINLAKCVKLK